MAPAPGAPNVRLLLALDQPLVEAQRVGDAGLGEWASPAMLDAIDFAEELGMMWEDEAERRRDAVREAFGDVDQGWPRARVAWSGVSN